MSWQEDKARLLRAMVKAEGGEAAFVRAIRCSVPNCEDFIGAMDIGRRTLDHALWDYAMSLGNGRPFIDFLGNRWAPVGAENDPANLNKNWPHNVAAIYERDHG